MFNRHRHADICLGFLVLWLFFSVPSPVSAQGIGRVTGLVTDATTGDPVVDAAVGIHGTMRMTGTDHEGRFLLDSVTPGLIRMSAKILGYLPSTTDYHTVRPDSTVEVNFRLTPAEYGMEGVEVTEVPPSPQHRQVEGAQVLRKEHLPARGNILDALQGVVPSVRTRSPLGDTRLVVRGASADVLYVLDGQVLRPPLTLYIDAADVDCVEVRKGFSAVREFKPSGDGEIYAGVVLIWTTAATGPRRAVCVGGYH